ncbi:MAG: FG-GAP repeat protein [Solirubrobacterales bacterium]
MFGVVETGDFNGDGRDDLAIGDSLDVQLNEEGFERQWGAVTVIYGSPTGLTGSGSQMFSKEGPSTGLPGEGGGHFGGTLASGDFNGDGRDELAVASPREDVDMTHSAGSVIVLRGMSTGLTQDNAQVWTQQSPGVMGDAEVFGEFGSSLASGDFDGSGHDDLLVTSTATAQGVPGAGAVNTLYGGSAGLSASGNQMWSQANLDDRPAKLEEFGRGLETADLDGDGADEAIIGVPEETGHPPRAKGSPGGLHVIFGIRDGLLSSGGLSTTGQLFFNGEDAVFAGHRHTLDSVGVSLVAGDWMGDKALDLAVNATHRKLQGKRHVGSIQLLGGQSDGKLGKSGSRQIHQGQPGIQGKVDRIDFFGYEVLVG